MSTYRIFAAWLLVVAGCASQTKLPEPVRAAVSARHTGRVVELRQSCFFGDLYDENEKWLLSPYPFDETYHIVDTDGAPIHPRGQRGVLPAGSAFVVQRVEFPDVAALARRMLTTPRYNPWVYLTPAEGNAVAPKERRHYILLLPMDLETEAGTEAALAELLAPAGEVSKWLAERRPSVRVGIEHKDAIEGMTVDELTAALGKPVRWFNETSEGKAARVAWYPSTELWLVDDAVASIKPARKVEAPKPAPSAPDAGATPTPTPATP